MITEENKNLLFKDLSSRFSYGVKVAYTTLSDNMPKVWDVIGLPTVGLVDIVVPGKYRFAAVPVEEIKPYLRPMSSMTEEELKDLNDKYGNIAYFFIQDPPYYHGLQAQHEDIGSIEISEFSEIYDWLDAHHFDYRGLIEKGLALEAKPEMYKRYEI